jgi:hypothetical protein
MSLWRVGRKVGRTIYQQTGDDPADGDLLIGVMATRELARTAVDAHNQREALLNALDALVVQLHREAREAEADGDSCCGETRRQDANLIAIAIGPYRTS